ncbi:MAG: recombinase RecF [Myxococcaceae bacterium]|nr:MAG: recombinase RecF [Myxococcaceae bacterium]
MLKTFRIKNYKSILDTTLELGRLNVFIGENGCGKTNLLEALAMASGARNGRLGTEDLASMGVRVAKPSITVSSFLGVAAQPRIELGCSYVGGAEKHDAELAFSITAKDPNDIIPTWIVERTIDTGATRLVDINRQLAAAKARVVAGSLHNDEGIELKELELAIDHYANSVSLPSLLNDFAIYNLSTVALRGLQPLSRREPVGIYGENLDVLFSTFDPAQRAALIERLALISWVSDVVLDPEDRLKFAGYKLGRSTSTLYFHDRFMDASNNVFSAENANEGILHILFYLTLFSSHRTPRVFAIDNIETALNPRLCRELTKQLAALAKEHDKQALVTTHNPAILDGLNLHDDDQRLFVVSRNDEGHTVTRRIRQKPDAGGEKRMLSELWMRGHLGGLPTAF